MPKIFDNIENYLIDGLKKTLEVSLKADFCVGYFNLRGWKHLSGLVEKYEGKLNFEEWDRPREPGRVTMIRAIATFKVEN